MLSSLIQSAPLYWAKAMIIFMVVPVMTGLKVGPEMMKYMQAKVMILCLAAMAPMQFTVVMAMT